MNRILEYVKTIKWWAGLTGAALTGASAIAGAPEWLTAVAAILTGIAVYELPFQPSPTSNFVDKSTV